MKSFSAYTHTIHSNNNKGVKQRKMDNIKRLKKRRFYLSSIGNTFDKRKYTNIDEPKHGFLPLPLNEYPYTEIELPTLISKESIKERVLNSFYMGKKIKDHNP